MVENLKKHIHIYREDNEYIENLISKTVGIENFAQALHYLIETDRSKEQLDKLLKIISKVDNRQKHMSLEQSTLSELVSDYLYIQHYHDDFVHINNGTETEAWANARKLALKHIKENQEDMNHKKNQYESYEHTKKRIISSQKNSNTFDIRPNIKRPGGLI